MSSPTIGTPRVICHPEPRLLLGEGPVWDEHARVLYWVDIERGEVHQCRADGSGARVTRIGERIGCLALRAGRSGFIAALEHRIAFVSLNPLSIETVAVLEPERSSNRCNDGKCDASGCFWVGTLHKAGVERAGWLYRIAPDGSTRQAAGPFVCTNGPEFSPDGRSLYCVDTYGKTIYIYAVEDGGRLSTRWPFVQFKDPAWGYPDGLTTDQEGCLWVAHWGGSRVSRFSPNGELLQIVQMPASQITSCVFGGESLQTLFITSASTGLDASNSEPLAGAIFAIHLKVGGVPANRFGG